MKNHAIFLLTVITVLASCKAVIPDEVPDPDHPFDYCGNGLCIEGELVDAGKMYVKNDRVWLWSGEDSSWHFDITRWDLTGEYMVDYGYDRETFAALLEPEYILAANDPDAYRPDEPVFILRDGDQIKVYPFILMRYHEVINEEVDGTPVMIAYCYLADLAAVYRRSYCGKTLTFGVSGYTNAEEHIWNDKQGFVLWDRETQSLWWPLMSRAVSGTMQGENMIKAPAQMWEISTWENVLTTMGNAVVMAPAHVWAPPTNWPQLQCEDFTCCEK